MKDKNFVKCERIIKKKIEKEIKKLSPRVQNYNQKKVYIYIGDEI